jgi:UDP-3-O-[3-hydroxymyristoyl] glucosamine N-acyltransferase
LVRIAHNVGISENCELIADTIIGGSTMLGDMCWTDFNSTLKDNIRIGNNVIVAVGATVIHIFKMKIYYHAAQETANYPNFERVSCSRICILYPINKYLIRHGD